MTLAVEKKAASDVAKSDCTWCFSKLGLNLRIERFNPLLHKQYVKRYTNIPRNGWPDSTNKNNNLDSPKIWAVFAKETTRLPTAAAWVHFFLLKIEMAGKSFPAAKWIALNQRTYRTNDRNVTDQERISRQARCSAVLHEQLSAAILCATNHIWVTSFTDDPFAKPDDGNASQYRLRLREFASALMISICHVTGSFFFRICESEQG